MTPELVMDFACAFGTSLDGGRVLVARDTRAFGTDAPGGASRPPSVDGLRRPGPRRLPDAGPPVSRQEPQGAGEASPSRPATTAPRGTP